MEFHNLIIYNITKNDQRKHYIWKSFDFFIFLPSRSTSNRLFCGNKFASVKRLLALEEVNLFRRLDIICPIRENSLSDPAEPARIENMYLAKDTRLVPIASTCVLSVQKTLVYSLHDIIQVLTDAAYIWYSYSHLMVMDKLLT